MNTMGILHRNFTIDQETRKKHRMCKTKTRVRWKEFQRSRLKSYRLQSTVSKKAGQICRAAMESERRTSEALCRRDEQIMVRQIMTGWLQSKDATLLQRNGENVSLVQLTSLKRRGKWRTPSPDQINACVVQTVYDNPSVSNMITCTSWKIAGRDQKALTSIDRRSSDSDMFDWSRKEPNEWWPWQCQACYSWTRSTPSPRKQFGTPYIPCGMAKCLDKTRLFNTGYMPGWQLIMTASETWHLLTMCSYLRLQNSSKTLVCDFKRSTEKVGLRIHPGRTKILSNQSSNIRKEIEIEDIKVEILTREESIKQFGPDGNFPAAGDDRNQKSRQGCLGNNSTSIDKSWHRKLTCLDIDFGYSTLWYPRRWTTPLEPGPSQKSMKEWFNQRNAKCFASSYKRKGDTNKLRNEKTRQMKMATQKTWVALKMKMRMDKVQTRASIRTATSLSRTILTTRLTQQRLKKKNGLNVKKKTKPLKRWRMRRFDVGSRLTKEWNGGWRWDSHLYRVKDG